MSLMIATINGVMVTMEWVPYANLFTDYVHGKYIFGMSRLRTHRKHVGAVRVIELQAVKYLAWLKEVDVTRKELAMEFSQECFLPEVFHPDSPWLGKLTNK